ncbi:MAG TPA: ABC transporter ATP-binding protein [Bryobacteraceae bacterium]|jgi:multiple sugar transport system ATP-binding protein|nr:ABC transporter ATP-binding protein [Bryobacteraceae bacterium]
MSLRVENIAKRFGEKHALRGVTLEANDGEFVVLLGPSGCGKSTLLRIIAGLEEPDAGSVLLSGCDITRLDPRRRDVAMVFQSYALYPHMTVAENIGYPLRVRKRPPSDISTEVERVGTRLGLAHLLQNLPKQLSGGERQRVALARAIIRHPKAFLMDEPLSNLDSRLRIDMRAELKHLQHELAVVTVYVTHDQVEAMTLASRIAILKDGLLQQYDTPSEVYRRPANLFVAGFIGSPSMNLLPGAVESGIFHRAGLSVALTPAEQSLIGPRREITLGIRPEHIDFAAVEQPDWTQARVWVAEDLGNETLLRLSLDDTHISLRAPAGTRADFDAPAWFRIRRDNIHWFDSNTTEAIR